jgi:hypothetical protein
LESSIYEQVLISPTNIKETANFQNCNLKFKHLGGQNMLESKKLTRQWNNAIILRQYILQLVSLILSGPLMMQNIYKETYCQVSEHLST